MMAAKGRIAGFDIDESAAYSPKPLAATDSPPSAMARTLR